MLFLQLGARLFRADASTGKNWKFQRDRIGVGRNTVVEAGSLVVPEARKIQLRQALFTRRIRRQLGDALLRIEGVNFRARVQGLVEQRPFVERRKVEEIQVVGDFEILVARQIEERGQAVPGGVGQRFGVDQILALVLQFDVGSHAINIQTDTSFLQFGCLFVESLCECDARFGGVARGQSAKNQEVLVHDGIYHDFARGLFVGPRLVGAFATDLVRANFREVQDGLRKSGSGVDYLIGAQICALRSAFDALDIVLKYRAGRGNVGLGKQSGAGNLTIAVAFLHQNLRDEPLWILLKRELHGLFQRKG